MGRSESARGQYRAGVFLLVGREVLVRTSDVVAILDHQALDAAPTREFVAFARRRGQVEDLCEGAPVKAAVVCRKRVLLSPVSGATLRRRVSSGVPI